MRRNFIDTDARNAPIAEELANLVPLLIPYRQSFENVLRRNLPQMRLGTRTLPRAGDSRWAHDRRAAGEPLFRLGQAGLLEARRLIRAFLFDMEELAAFPPRAADGLGQRVARALAGVTHWKVAKGGRATLVQAMGQDTILEQVGRYVAHLDDDQPFTTPCVIRAGGLTGRGHHDASEEKGCGSRHRASAAACREMIGKGGDGRGARRAPGPSARQAAA